FLLPAAVFPDGADFGRVVLHAVIVVVEAGILMWMSVQVVAVFEASAKANEEARIAHEHEAQLAAEKAEQQLQTMERERVEHERELDRERSTRELKAEQARKEQELRASQEAARRESEERQAAD